MTRPVHANIDLDALRHNLAQVHRAAPGAKVMAIVKADAYGHNLLKTCFALALADGFGLLDIADAISLREAGFSQPISLLEGFFNRDELDLIAEHQLEPVIHSSWQLDQLQDFESKQNFSAWLKIDTGMNRLGFSPVELEGVLHRLSTMRCIDKVRVMSHLANADTPTSRKTQQQLAQFLTATDMANPPPRSIANSAAILSSPDCHLDWVRPGIMLYGSSPLAASSAGDLNLKPVMSLRSEIISIKSLKKGDSVGYGSTWTCPEDMRVAVVACGYGDGYPRHAPSGTPISVAGKLTMLVGRVSMDMITVDLRGIDDAEVGSPVELWGNEVPIDSIAEQAGTISYELLCGVTARVTRQEVYSG